MPSPRSHVYRLVLILAVALGGFLYLKDYFIPDSWDYEAWYRKDALPLLAQQASQFGGNESCQTAGCHAQPDKDHEEKLELLEEDLHEKLACEGCHGPLLEHAEGGKKVADARVLKESRLCLRCHDSLLGREEKLAQFDPQFRSHKKEDVTRDTECVECHDPHSPLE